MHCIQKPWTGKRTLSKQNVQKRAPKFQHTDSMRQWVHRPSGMLQIQVVVFKYGKRPHEKCTVKNRTLEDVESWLRRTASAVDEPLQALLHASPG